ncbi:hypothetical protein BDV09DRAFT_163330 [Aspergillus tetrazonus]
MVLFPAARYTSIPSRHAKITRAAQAATSQNLWWRRLITLIRISVIAAILVWTYHFTANAPRNTAFGVPRPFSGPGSQNKRSGWSTWSM